MGSDVRSPWSSNSAAHIWQAQLLPLQSLSKYVWCAALGQHRREDEVQSSALYCVKVNDTSCASEVCSVQVAFQYLICPGSVVCAVHR